MPPPGRSGVLPLIDGPDAFAARVAVIRAAQVALDVQYYIWERDATGLILLDELRRAAERGVRVRLLLDDNGISGLDRELAALDALPAYVAGKPAADDGIHRFKVSSNESHLPPIPSVRDAAVAAMESSNRYPDASAQQLRAALGQKHGVDPAQIALSTGAVAVTGDLVRALVGEGDEVVFAWRSFEAYPILVGIMGAVDEEAPGLDRGQLAPDMGHPVHLGQFRDGEGLRAMGRRQKRQRDLVGAFGEINADLPAVRAVLDLEDAAADGLGGQVLAVLGQGLGGLAALKVRQRGPGRHQAAPPAATELPPVDEGEGSGLPSISPVAASCSALACDACTPVPRRAQ